ncbi:MAG TPA: ABC transporter permease, partial [Hyphomicrobiaceae bacterium]|nr:ABC transporter permease [Hyphomicrobiaceae bacterium]
MSRSALILTRLALLAMVLAAWEWLPRWAIVNATLLPPLSDVLAMFFTMLGRSQVQEAIGVTAGEVVLAFMFAVPIGAGVGVLVAESEYFGQIFRPMLFYVFSIPKSIFLPMLILVFGIGFEQKV